MAKRTGRKAVRGKKTSAGKMKWKSITGGTFWKPEKVGDSLMGVYMGNRITKVENRKTMIHSIATPDGESVDVWDSTALSVLASLPKKTPVRITFEGRKKGKGKRTFKQFEIQVPEATKFKPVDAPF